MTILYNIDTVEVHQLRNAIKNIKTTMYAREHIKFVFNGFKAKTKYEISKAITENIPELKKLIKPKRKIWEAESYSQGIFDAVSLGITHYFLSE